MTSTDAPAVARLDDETFVAQLTDALERRDLGLLYTPVASRAYDGVVAFEAAVRWMHPDLGALRGWEFVPRAARLGLAGPIERWVLDSTLPQITEWRRSLSLLTVWVTVGRRLLTSDAVDEFVAAVVDHGVPDGILGVEVPSPDLRDHADEIAPAVARLAEAGIMIAVDDVEADDLELVDLVPARAVKLPRSVVAGLEDGPTAEVGAMVEQIGARGLEVVAKGVDSPRVMASLEALGVDQLQGTLVGRPESAHMVTLLLAASTNLLS